MGQIFSYLQHCFSKEFWKSVFFSLINWQWLCLLLSLDISGYTRASHIVFVLLSKLATRCPGALLLRTWYSESFQYKETAMCTECDIKQHQTGCKILSCSEIYVELNLSFWFKNIFSNFLDNMCCITLVFHKM